MTYAYAEARVKGGMPVLVDGYVDMENGYRVAIIERVLWYNTEKPVSKKFIESLSYEDWDRISEAVFDMEETMREYNRW